ncbi:hypothetical protein Maq22A_c05065 [Methylobacterium aquaticum]|uniref:Uncharacterized protein n=1 Tax=Methylobacterium aquaticum TaxID=270351 RepID=A0A0C6FH51_9HYPH|nr:hypothetical protein Maq22A_c05065 [Methylobacterium aquaticum]
MAASRAALAVIRPEEAAASEISLIWRTVAPDALPTPDRPSSILLWALSQRTPSSAAAAPMVTMPPAARRAGVSRAPVRRARSLTPAAAPPGVSARAW